METTYYTLTAREILVEGAAVQQVSGGGARQLVCVRKESPRSDEGKQSKVIDFAAWKADREEKARLEELWYDGVDEYPEEEPEIPAPRARRSHKSVINGELFATVAVVAVMVVLIGRILFAF